MLNTRAYSLPTSPARPRVHVVIHLPHSFWDTIRSVAILLSSHSHCRCFVEDLRRANMVARWATLYYYLYRLSLLSSHCKRRGRLSEYRKVILRESGSKLCDLSLLEYRDDEFAIFNNLELTWKILIFPTKNLLIILFLFFILSSKVNR